MPNNYWSAIGYLSIKNFILRIDVFEKVFYLARQKLKKGPFLESPDLMNPIGCNSEQLKDIMKFCGYSYIILNDGKKLYFLSPRIKKSINKITKNKSKTKVKKNFKPKIKTDPNSPFAVLEKLL